ncbi:ROK family protein [Intestinirhabdus alba]|jgi:predicted NBD/HSP70 family sugar kinase|uniref:ROK family protein n=1 Tax=Intestinirhabdus alba TaxID=2899544 RepID=A0A6L6IH80_9ENTR|nr:ROK family protein [Intestinirhabdus alba]MTH45267.1 ROK family protein [Intestinirhabdus alba]
MFDVGLNNSRMRQLNKELIMSLLWREKRVTKSQVARAIELSIPAVSNILEELLAEGQVCHSETNLSHRGVGSGSWLLPTHTPLTLCLNVTPTTLESQLVDHQLSVVGDLTNEAVDAPTPTALLEAISRRYIRCQKAFPDKKLRLAIAMHGQVDAETGVSQYMPQAPWREPVEVKYILEERLKCPVIVDNDCIMLALAEKWQGDNPRKDFCVINVDYGIGSSFIINNAIYRGSLYGSGQIGHTIVDPDGKACSCGRYGCLETVASLSAIKKQVRTGLKLNAGITAEEIEQLDTDLLIALWRQKVPMVQRLVEDGANAIGLSLYNFLNILNINQIWLYGRSCRFGEAWLETIVRHVVGGPFDPADTLKKNATRIEFGQLTRQQQVVGIAWLYVEESLSALRAG